MCIHVYLYNTLLHSHTPRKWERWVSTYVLDRRSGSLPNWQKSSRYWFINVFFSQRKRMHLSFFLSLSLSLPPSGMHAHVHFATSTTLTAGQPIRSSPSLPPPHVPSVLYVRPEGNLDLVGSRQNSVRWKKFHSSHQRRLKRRMSSRAKRCTRTFDSSPRPVGQLKVIPICKWWMNNLPCSAKQVEMWQKDDSTALTKLNSSCSTRTARTAVLSLLLHS